MGNEIKVIDVKREKGIVISVKIMAGPFEMDCVKHHGKITNASVIRYDKHISSRSDLHIPYYLYNPAIKIVHGIFNS